MHWEGLFVTTYMKRKLSLWPLANFVPRFWIWKLKWYASWFVIATRMRQFMIRSNGQNCTWSWASSQYLGGISYLSTPYPPTQASQCDVDPCVLGKLSPSFKPGKRMQGLNSHLPSSSTRISHQPPSGNMFINIFVFGRLPWRKRFKRSHSM